MLAYNVRVQILAVIIIMAALVVLKKKKKRPQAQNAVIYAKPYITKLRLIVSTLPEIES